MIRAKGEPLPMTLWRIKAFETFPELVDVLVEADSPMVLWLRLMDAFDDAYTEPRNEGLIRRIYDFADWCLVQEERSEDPGEDLPTSVMVCFFEDIPTREASQADMPRWFVWEEISSMRATFGYHLSDAEFDQLHRLFIEAKRGRQKQSARKQKRRNREK